MKKYRLPLLASLFSLTIPLLASADVTTLVEAEDFQLLANWLVDSAKKETSGDKFLKTSGSDSDALTVISLPEDGLYHCWVRARDYLIADPGTRRYQLVIDSEPFEKEVGAHGKDGWRWEKVGTRQLSKGDHVLGLRDTARFYGRCDAVLLTTSDFDPNNIDRESLRKQRVEPKRVTVRGGVNFPSPPRSAEGSELKSIAKLQNSHVRITFLAGEDSAGKPLVTRQTELFHDGQWIKLPLAQEETLFILSASRSGIRTNTFSPTWEDGSESSFEVNGRTYTTKNGRSPFGAGRARLLIPRSCELTKEGAVLVHYDTREGITATGLWELPADRRDATLSVTFQAPYKGEYSVGFSPFQSWNDGETEYHLLNPLYQHQRRPETANLLTDIVTPHALALVQAKVAGRSLSFAAIADPDGIPYRWPVPTAARYGFSLLNAHDRIQPSIFAPVLGLEDSKMNKGESKTVKFRILAETANWQETLAYCSDKIFEVTDYRKPLGASLTDAALNMIDLIMDTEHGGWDEKLKGFYNIEALSTAGQVSPLAVVSAALLTQDEEFYVKRALPTIEFTLSRPGAHFALLPQVELGYVAPENTRIHVPSRFFGTAYWQGLHALLGERNRWIADLALKDGKPRYATSYNTMPLWSEKLGQYRLSPDPALLETIKKEADAHIESHFRGKITDELGVTPFYNIHFYPYWWDFIDLYELTGETKYLQAAQEGGFYTVAGQWSHPKTPKGDVTIHPGGKWGETPRFWWKDSKEFRLGWPLKPDALPEKNVPAWVVSPVGLGLEQPSTYFGGGNGGMGNILMSSWAPSLLRLYQHTGREIFQTYARNSIIGRFTNYPGYYVRGFTDLNLNPRYPLDGPDLTSIYYHHIAPQLAFTLEYILTEAEQRSGGKIRFPWVRQQGYCWFTNRIYGSAPGTIGDESGMRLWIDREAVKVGPAAVTWFAARKEGRFSLVLMNEANETVTPEITLDTRKIGLPQDTKVSVTLPPRGMKVVSLDTRPMPALGEVPALETAPAAVKLDGDWGTLHAFRIRSPFGKDSLYVVLTGRPSKSGSVQLHLEDEEKPREAQSFPYEFSVYPWATDRDMTFRVVCTDGSGGSVESAPITLKGSRP